jgi:anti-sigma factor RsiW
MKRAFFGSLHFFAIIQSMSLQNITDYDLQALVDNELDWEDQKAVLDHVERDPEAKKRYEELKAQKEALKKYFERM